jgi:hypothetical protein
MRILQGNQLILRRAQIATHTGLPDDVAAVCHRVLASYEEMHPWLAENPELADDVWMKLWGKKRPESELARRLVSRPLTKEQRDIVIDRENRVGVLNAFIEHNRLLPEEQALLSGKANARAALLRQGWLEQHLRKPIALHLRGLPLLREMALAADGVFTEAEILGLMQTYPDWIGDMTDPRKGAGERNRMLRILFGRYPGVVSTLIQHPGFHGRIRIEVLTSAAGSANLRADDAALIALVDEHGISRIKPANGLEMTYCLLALLGNPRCPHRVARAVSAHLSGLIPNLKSAAERRLERPEIDGDLSAIDDPDTLAWLAQRALPYRGQDVTRAGRPLEILALARNPHVGKDLGERIIACIPAEVERELIAASAEAILQVHPGSEILTAEPVHNPRTAQPWQVLTDAMEFAIKKLGTDQVRWETLLGLIDDYDGTFEELVHLAETI